MGARALMRVVLETNVLLSALISSQGAPDIIYRAWRMAKFELVTSTVQLDELRRVSRYPKLKAILPAHRIGAMVNNMQRGTIMLDQLPNLPQGIEVSRAIAFTPETEDPTVIPCSWGCGQRFFGGFASCVWDIADLDAVTSKRTFVLMRSCAAHALRVPGIRPRER